MRTFWACIYVLCAVASAHWDDCSELDDSCPHPIHISMQLHHPDHQLAAQVAARHDLNLLGKIGDLPGHYYLGYKAHHETHRHKREAAARISEDSDVKWSNAERPKRRVKRDMKSDLDPAGKTPVRLPWGDPLYSKQWYLHGGAIGGFDMRVREAWQLGVSGKGVAVSILDDGIQRNHADIIRNYDPEASTDINDHDDDPMPQNNGDNKHGTRCAGEVAAEAGNRHCGVGIAFDAKIGGVRMLDGPVSDSVEAGSLALNQQHIDIYSASWGPEDDGKTFDGPGQLAREAFRKGIVDGRGGKGNIFVWASGNGGSHRDSCSCDGYTTSIYTLSISSATFDNKQPWYLEECPSTIAATYSSASMNQPAIVTVDVPRGCTERHTGTSASAPIAAGIIALALEANRNLTWRDMQHIVLQTADPTALLNNPGWSTNGVGRKVSNKFGYGLMDAGAIVRLAQKWKTVPQQQHCQVDFKMPQSPVQLTGRFLKNFTLEVGDCSGKVRHLEHIQALITARLSKRGDLQLVLTSPKGTRSVLLPPRPADNNHAGFHQWPFLSVQQWGEDPRGVWTLTIMNVGSERNQGTFHDWSMLIYGTPTPAEASSPTDQPTSDPWMTSEGERGNIQVDFPRQSGYRWGEGMSEYDTQSSPVVSVGDCHPECDQRGCTNSNSASACFGCTNYNQTLRNRSGFKCVSSCTEVGYFADVHQCRQCKRMCATCSDAETCDTCHDQQFLVDVESAHFHHGSCVDVCPEELVPEPDLPATAQAKCVRPESLCDAANYYNNGNCYPCGKYCKGCRGPTSFDCVSCAESYRNASGYCRICCTDGQKPDKDKCLDCSQPLVPVSSSGWLFSHPATFVGVVCFGGVLIFLILFGCFMWKDRHYDRDAKKWAYSQLPIRYDLDRRNGIMKSGANGVANGIEIISDSEDEITSKASDEEEDTVFDTRIAR